MSLKRLGSDVHVCFHWDVQKGEIIMKIKAAIKDYLLEIEIRKYTTRTIKTYRVKLSIFQRFCEEMDVDDMDDVTMAVIRKFTQKMGENGRKATYINGCLKTIKSFTQYCYEEGYGGFNTKHNFKWVREDKPVIRALTVEDIKLMLKACNGTDYLSIRDKAIITMLFETGIRCLELCQIKPTDIFDDYIIINGKNRKQRVVPVTPILKKAMLRYERTRDKYFVYKKTDDYYFLSYRGNQLTNSGMEHLIKSRGKGIQGVRLSPHTLRHTYSQQQLKMGTSLFTISKILGHSNLRITQVYLDSLRDEDLIEMTKQQSTLMNLK